MICQKEIESKKWCIKNKSMDPADQKESLAQLRGK